MLKVTIELLSAITHRTSTLGVMYLSNDGQGTRERGNYDVRVMRKGVTSPLGKTTREGRVEDYPRLAYNVWRLIGRAIHAAFPEEREPGIAKLNADVMNGLHAFRAAFDAQFAPDRNQYARAAQEWLDAAGAEPDTDDARVSEALGCNMPEGDAREAFQRSIFRGLKAVRHRWHATGTESEQTLTDIDNALKFIEALPE